MKERCPKFFADGGFGTHPNDDAQLLKGIGNLSYTLILIRSGPGRFEHECHGNCQLLSLKMSTSSSLELSEYLMSFACNGKL